MEDDSNLPPIMTLEAFAAKHGLTTRSDVRGHIHAGLRSKPTTKTFDRFYYGKLDQLDREAEKTRIAYEAAIEAGTIRRPPPLTSEEIAQGHPDNPATQAAQRILEKRKARLLQEQQAKANEKDADDGYGY